jgi:Spy/CpxP family protein refolding chaperone
VNRKFFIVIALLLAVAAGLAAHAATQVRGGRYSRHDGWMLRRMTRELNLTEAQQDQVKSIWKAEKAKIQPLRLQLRQNQQAENANVTGAFDETQARAFAGKQAQIMSDLIVEKQRTRSAIYAVLTPDQRARAAQLIEERQQRRQQHMQKFSQQQPQTQ